MARALNGTIGGGAAHQPLEGEGQSHWGVGQQKSILVVFVVFVVFLWLCALAF